ncbi:hypothetical protein R2255_002588 [Cronobacter dublinensis]|uniref:hypothetical protein n=1 Tax=Cronobacter dublinensis TaxID=413497 RepID=UPI0027383313|nr:hypothetical protein [Cronobacter dublinensis]ELQ6125605.1 hypothetical protein [Cronobacter dublinensis]
MTPRLTGIALALLALPTLSAQASSDIEDCTWGASDCVLQGEPWLDVTNDTRDNLMRLIGEQKQFALPVYPLPADLRNTREYHFGYHADDGTTPVEAPAVSAPAAAAPDLLATLLTAMHLDPAAATVSDTDRETRFVSNNSQSVIAFLTALNNEKSLTDAQRQHLAQARLSLYQAPDSQPASVNAPQGTPAAAFDDYLAAATAFYQGDYPAAAERFSALKASQQPWVAQTAAYMLMRVALNQSTAGATDDEYGLFDTTKIDKAAARQALGFSEDYLKSWPTGDYADSARGMQRRIYWYLQDWDALAPRYEQALKAAPDADALRALLIENDSKLQSKDASGESWFVSSPDAPLLTFTQTLRWLREYERKGEKNPHVTRQMLDDYKPIYEKAGLMPLWNYLQNAWLFWQQEDYAAVTAAIKPADSLPQHDILALSEQVLYGDALGAQKQWAAARDHWQRLLKSAKPGAEQQLLQMKLAAALVENNETAAIFAPESLVTGLRYRSLVLKTKASPELLKAEAQHGMNNEDRTIALHTLLTRHLIAGRYQDYLNDKALAKDLRPLDEKTFGDVNLQIFNWKGDDVAEGYACPTLDDTAKTLAGRPDDSHALNCLGEFFRLTDARVNRWGDSGGNSTLDSATDIDHADGQPDRQHYYQQVIANPKAEPEDKSYALYRAVMCYAPSGYNDCGGKEVDKATRKAWFGQLKKNWPGSPWAQQLKYYW